MFRDMNPNWTLCSLLALTATLETGCRPKGGVGGIEQGIPSIGAEHLSDQGDFALDNTRFIPQCFYYAMHRGRIHPGDILIVKDGATTGKVSYVGEDWPFSHAAVNEHVFILRPTSSALARYVFFFLYSTAGQHQIKKAFHGSAQGGINQSFIEQVAIPLPPLPVQERIVAILQKADEIRRKRQETLKIADQILPALFIEMFGDPATNPKGWPVVELARVLATCQAGTWGHNPQNVTQAYPVLRSTNMRLDGRLDFQDVALRAVPNHAVPRYSLQDGDLLLNRSSGSKEHIGKLCLFRQPSDAQQAFLFSNFVQRLRPDPVQVTSEYLFFYLRTEFARHTLERLQATSSGLRNLNMSEYLRQPVMIPPLPLQDSFSQTARALEEATMRNSSALLLAEATFNVLLQRAFTGELTAEWEARNADWIAQQQAFYERLPQLVLLAFLREKAQRAQRTTQAAVLITALMKYAFLLQMEGASRRRLYNFVPYHYGPFAQEVYSDLKALQDQGLVTIEEDDEKTRISLAALDKAEQALHELPEDLQQDVSAVIEAYGSLDHETLLNVVYERYPGYAKKSRRRSALQRSE